MDPVLTRVTFADGSTRSLRGNFTQGVAVLGLSDEGRVVVQNEGFPYTYGLTLCCNAYDKGGDTGVYCRRCYGDDCGEYDAVAVVPVALIEVIPA
jgi:hypothetical protein